MFRLIFGHGFCSRTFGKMGFGVSGPPAPTDLVATVTGSSTITLTWSNPE